ncbi:ATP-grasp domain-containing protein [Desulfopila sp. IMCC35008]|uniref:ATP-grasp domain-containing protein n=1 Tax=Desulfopila sp. IMCC35008 TaxID=2653858 RepID=UPI0013D87F4D|nr:ATP-grasp domain-containing protein [Desulfopila sp. IMCC35008]
MKVAIIYNKDLSGVLNKFGMQNKEFYSEKNVKKVSRCLEQAGHNTTIIDGNMYVIERLQNFMPRTIDGEQMGMVFNMAYGIQGESRYTHLPSMLEMLGIPYVGSTPSGHALALDKVMTKVVWQNKGLPTPDFWVFSSPHEDFSDVRFPVIVKPKMESVSFGLKVVYDEDALRESIHFIITEFKQQALVEQFIPGREFAVGLLGNSPVEAFPVLEFDLEGDPDAIQTEEDKKKKPRQKICPADIPHDFADKLTDFSRRAFQALELRDFARVDIRVDANNNIYLLEINSMASLGQTGSYVAAAKVAGYDYCVLVNKMLDVAAVRYFSETHLSSLPSEKNRTLPTSNRLRTFLRGRQQNTEAMLEKFVNIDTHLRNIEGVNSCTDLIKTHLTQLNFTNEIYPQFEVGNLMFLTNTMEDELDYLLLMPVDDSVKMSRHESYQATEHRLYGTGIWENKGGVVTCLSALQALRFAKLLKKIKIGIFVITDSSVSGKFSKTLISQKALKAKHVVSLHGGNTEGSVITSRSGSASYNYSLKLIDSSCSENVAIASSHFFKAIASVLDIGKNDEENVIAPYSTDFQSNIFKMSAYGSAKISVRFNAIEDFEKIDQRIRKITTLPRKLSKVLQSQLDGGVTRQPLPATPQNNELFRRLCKIAKSVDSSITEEHRWSSADICNIPMAIGKVDGLGPMGGFDKQKSEFILRQSIIDRALLLALLLKGN